MMIENIVGVIVGVIFWGGIIVGIPWLMSHLQKKARKRAAEKEIICPNPNCGYKGKPKIKKCFSVTVFIILWLLGIFPALLYVILVRDKILCPKCGMTAREFLE
ncbi:MAG: hypothetical protein CO162_08025 [bacterium (Candidatus Ratteibacteria) CG_4_9_14_3_um_filter_41_21]|uniref:LITAF domain-containing protein n=2 Tax=Candidatus Ratteibacteria TaxID=2979319 RepID=A0A2M7YDS4_9BACT|nr:MAG: hypothetical protein COS11_04865 [bacterium (Candidatus Ratteibacteria) CG01_land_8_20_14_3_00_40_19]PJA61118.1 MAG: hypothetical protein CO162_08025 [bacterium (Candidatus Ratteibacteria) CG_4_9_14_3_um_filter_41_21]